jgi:hypothetical protein
MEYSISCINTSPIEGNNVMAACSRVDEADVLEVV